MPEPKPIIPRRGSQKTIETFTPRAVAYEVKDERTPGLVLRINPTGKRVFRWYCTARKRVITIGPWSFSEQPGHVTLAQARDWLEELKKAHTAGVLDAKEAELKAHLRRRERVADPTPQDRRTLKAVAEEWYTDDVAKNRKHPGDVRRVLDQDLLPALGAQALDEITTLNCRDAIKRVVTGIGRESRRAAPAHAGKVLSLLKQFFGWAQANGFTDRNPAAPLRGRHLGVEENKSDRWLTSEEIPVFWHALDADRGPVEIERPDPRTGKVQKYLQRVPALEPATAAAMRILLLTAVRTGELLRARWEHLDLEARTWTIPPTNQKLTKRQERTAKPFVIALPPTALALFKELQEAAKGSPWVLPGKPRKGEGESKVGHFEEKVFGHALRRMIERKALDLPGGPVTPHDLRRTARTHLAKLKVPHWIVERVLNHSLGKIAATYDQHDYFEERRDALLLWDAFVLRLVAPEQTNVVPIAEGTR